MRPRM